MSLHGGESTARKGESPSLQFAWLFDAFAFFEGDERPSCMRFALSARRLASLARCGEPSAAFIARNRRAFASVPERFAFLRERFASYRVRQASSSMSFASYDELFGL
jgi:hypothetical protein